MKKILQKAILLGPALVLSTPLASQTFRSGEPPVSVTAFASAIALSGGTVFVGRPGELSFFPAPASHSGTVHAFGLTDDGSWDEHEVISGAGSEPGDGFGDALAASGDVLVVGAPRANSGRGTVYIFERGEMGWGAGGTEIASGEGSEGDGFGFSVDVLGNLALVGAPGHSESRGAVFVLRLDAASGEWEIVAQLAGSAMEPGDRFGASIAINGDRVLIGAPGPHPAVSLVAGPPEVRTGSAYIFELAGGSWEEKARLVASDSAAAFGVAVLLDGPEAIVSAPAANQGAGAVYSFATGDGDWTETEVFAVEDVQGPALMGISMARAGPDLLVGAPLASHLAGTVYVLRKDESTGRWARAQDLGVTASGLGAFLGSGVAADGNLAVLGAPGADFFEGVGFVFVREGGEWRESASIVDKDSGLESVVGGQVECEDGKANIFGCSNVDLISFLPLSALAADRGIQVSDVWGWTDPETGNEYAIVGRFNATMFIDLTDPASPVYLGELPMSEGANSSLWRDMKVYNDHAFIVADGAGAHGMQVFDLTQLRDVAETPVIFEETARYDGIFSAHNIVINEETGFAYAVGSNSGGETCGGGLHMIDIREPTNPTFAGCFADPATGNGTGYSHDAQCITYDGPDSEHVGKEICFGANAQALSVADVTDKENPVALAAVSYPNASYTHQGWVSDDHRYFFLDDELDEISGSVPRTRTIVWDIQDLDDPVVATEYMGETGATDHNLYVRGNYMYQSNYVSGLRIIDIRDPENPREVAHFDTVPLGANAPGFAGSWSNYPFFESGMIVVTSMREGVFVLKQRPEELVP